MTEESAAERKLAESVFDISPRRERTHDRDCPACDIANEVAGVVAAYWDPLENWHETETDDGLDGDTLLVQLVRMAAHVLHRRLPGYQRPPDHVIVADFVEEFERREKRGTA